MKLLIVEANQIDRNATRVLGNPYCSLCSTKERFEIMAVATEKQGIKALEKDSSELFDIVFVDIWSPSLVRLAMERGIKKVILLCKKTDSSDLTSFPSGIETITTDDFYKYQLVPREGYVLAKHWTSILEKVQRV